MDSVTHNNVVTANNRGSAQKMWAAIKERFASSQASNRARIFNDFLYIKFQEDRVETFVTDVKVTIKKMVHVGIDLPQDILAYLVLFKFPPSMQILKRQIMHLDKELNVEFRRHYSRARTRKKPGNKQNNNLSKRCRNGYHNPKQDVNHNSESCWHLHPEKAPEWWRESQAQWKASKEAKDKSENYFISLLTLWVELGDPKSRIILDSGASGHIFNDLKFFNDIKMGEFDSIKTGKKDANLPIKGRGTIVMTWGRRTIQLKNCLYVPDIVINLVSAGQLVLNGCSLFSSTNQFKVEKVNQIVLEGNISNGLFSIRNPDSVGLKHVANISSDAETLQDLHEKFGHASVQRIEQLADQPISQSEKDSFECKACTLAKITKQSFKHVSQLASKPFERLHMDLIGPIKPESTLKHNFILTVVDNHSGYLAGFPASQGYYPTMICSDGGANTSAG
ncbi:hypothetical protein VP01_5782g2 [Puccinia sorghi]|uniref:Retrovirus-related Pol polyprotein from transposon TNT 1-94-like beta-barrel domain-containing protein n=1 Tax=Puccinia sorghi TaxID=27349 RepID=A0A0L6UI90_9BASI|nr:hypothetical protein VP01_5782g2 [Puccinia sorghi]